MPIASYPRITLNTTGQTNNPRSGIGLAIYNQASGQYVIADSSLYPINSGGLASENTLDNVNTNLGLIETNVSQIQGDISSSGIYQQGLDISRNFTLPFLSTPLPSNTCVQMVIISPVNGFWITINGGTEMFIPPYTTLPINTNNTDTITARYQIAGDVLFYYYH
jgi:hypothetical protein